MEGFGFFGVAAAIALAAVGSAAGAGIAGMSAVGSWKKCYASDKKAPFMLVAFTGFPLSQTIYGLILMNSLITLLVGADASDIGTQWAALGLGIFGGLGMGASALYQGKAAACACDSLAETGKGTLNYILVLGIIETVALFVMAFLMTVTGKLGVPVEAVAEIVTEVTNTVNSVVNTPGM